jgi:glycosyltransferase involved in cell wall biosynthesis
MVREISPFGDFASLVKLLPVIRRLRPDIIHAHSGKGGIFGRLCGTLLGSPVVFTPHGFSYLGQNGFRRWIVLGIEKVLTCFAALLMATSPSEGKRAVTEVGWCQGKVSVKFPNSIEISGDTVKHNARKTARIIMVNRLSYQKNPQMALRVARLVADHTSSIRFIVLGAGYGDECGSSVAELMLNLRLAKIVSFREWCDPTGVTQELLRSDIFISTSRYEGLPYTVLEAMEKGLPVVATRIDGVVDLVEHGQTGFLTEIDDDATMAGHIMRLAADANLRRKLGQAGKEKIKNLFNIDKNIKKLEEIYYSLIHQEDNR